MTTPLVYIMFKLGMENKQYEISFEVVISLQTKLQFQNFPHAFFLSFLDFKKIQVHGSLNN
jgi:hypothetical protein